MTNEYDSDFYSDLNFYNQNTKDLESFNNKKMYQQYTTPPTSPFLYASYESTLSCGISFSSCSPLSPVLTPTTTISSHSSSLSTDFLDDLSLIKIEQESPYNNNGINEEPQQPQTQLNQQNQHYYNKEQSRILENYRYLKCEEFHDEQYKIDPGFLNSNLNLFKWTFIKPKFPLLFEQMYDKANGCFFLAGIPAEFIFEYNNQDLLTEDCNL